MAEYIEKDKVLHRLYVLRDGAQIEVKSVLTHVIREIRNIPAANVRENVTGPTEDALEMIRSERQRQIDLRGEYSNNHPFEWMSILGEEFGELCEAINETYFQSGKHPERGGRDAIIREAVQVAAVAVAIIEANCGADMRWRR